MSVAALALIWEPLVCLPAPWRGRGCYQTREGHVHREDGGRGRVNDVVITFEGGVGEKGEVVCSDRGSDVEHGIKYIVQEVREPNMR